MGVVDRPVGVNRAMHPACLSFCLDATACILILAQAEIGAWMCRYCQGCARGGHQAWRSRQGRPAGAAPGRHSAALRSTLRGVGLLREHLPPAVRHPQVHACSQVPPIALPSKRWDSTSALYSVQTWDPASCSGRQCDGIDLPCKCRPCARPACFILFGYLLHFWRPFPQKQHRISELGKRV